MRRLIVPTVLPYHSPDYVLAFKATREELLPLGEPGFIEGDSYRTAGGLEFFWAFETEDGLRFQVAWAEAIETATVVADPPDAQRTLAALRELGLGELQTETRSLPKEHELKPRHARGAVWLFTPEGMSQPTAVFSRKQLADQWLARTRFSGTLKAFPIDTTPYDFERKFETGRLPLPNSDEAQRFIGTIGERYDYVEGKQLVGHERWQLWRQDDNGTRFLVARFHDRSEAVEALRKMEGTVHKQTYWVSQQEELK